MNKNKIFLFLSSIISIIVIVSSVFLFIKNTNSVIAKDNAIILPVNISEDIILPELIIHDSNLKVDKYIPTLQNKFESIIENFNNNEDIIGSLRIGDTTINYPVVQSVDNIFYLDKDENKNYRFAGSVFMDYENSILSNDKNTILYGHNMNQDYMFHTLRYYFDKDYYNENKYINFDTIYGNQTWEVFAFYKTDINFNYIKVYFDTEEEFGELLNEMKNRSVHNSNVEVTTNDRILTLSTCSNQETDTRLVLNAKLIDFTPYKDLSILE